MKLVFVFFMSCFLVIAAAGDSETVLRQLLERVETLEKQDAVQKQRLIQFENEQLADKQRIQELDIDMALERQRIKELEVEIRQLKNANRSPAKRTEEGDDKIKRLILETELVAFHAYRTTNAAHNHIRQELVFDTVTLNIGDAYNNKTGMFVTPKDGIYIFSTSITCTQNSDGHNHVDIMKNGVEMGAAYASGNAGSLDQGSMTVVMQLTIGDVIYVSIQRHDDILIAGDKLSSFTGCLVTPL